MNTSRPAAGSASRSMAMRRRTLGGAVAEELLERIRRGESPPGARLPTEKELMEEFGVGRNVVREAVQALSVLGLVDIRPGRGATVMSLDTAEALDAAMFSSLLNGRAVEDLFELRRALENEIASLAAERATPEQVDALTVCLDAYRAAVVAGRPLNTLDAEFHALIAAASHSGGLAITLERCSDLIKTARRTAYLVPWAAEQALVDHSEIVDAIRAHDPALARTVMNRHMDGALATYREARSMSDRGNAGQVTD